MYAEKLKKLHYRKNKKTKTILWKNIFGTKFLTGCDRAGGEGGKVTMDNFYITSTYYIVHSIQKGTK